MFRRISPIGFGCSSLTGTSRTIALATLEAAFDAGVRHFDVARYYGWGDAETILGNFIACRRSEVTITSKFGIQPPKLGTLLGAAVKTGRRAVRSFPFIRPLLQRRASVLVRSGRFRADQAKVSLDESLKALRTEYLDIYLSHDYIVSEESRSDLLQFLNSANDAGTIRQFGISADIVNIQRAIHKEPEFCNVLQFGTNILTRHAHDINAMSDNHFLITYGALGSTHKVVKSFLNNRRDLLKKWSSQLQLDLSSPDVISSLLLNYAVKENPNGIVLFSSRDPQRAFKNARAVLEPTVSRDQVNAFASWVQSEPMRYAV